MENDEKIYSYWIALVPWMDQEHFVEYEDFRSKMLPKRQIITNKSDDEILKEMLKIREKFK